MKNTKIKDELMIKLKDIQDRLTEMLKSNYLEGKEEVHYHIDFLERVIDRIYPEDHAKKMKIKLHSTPNTPSDFMLKEEIAYKEKLKRAISVIGLIADEDTYFGFDDFTPIKEKIENEAGIKIGPFKLGRKTTKEK